MSHIPGVKPDLKVEWKKASREEKIGVVSALFSFAIFFIVGFAVFLIGEIDTMEKMEHIMKLIILILFVFTGYFMMHTRFKQSNQLEKYRRVKKGLRFDWDAEDLDELEERVRKLEERN